MSINGLYGKRDKWAALRTRVSARKPGVGEMFVTEDSWIFDAYRGEIDVEAEEEEAEGEEEVEEEDEDWTVHGRRRQRWARGRLPLGSLPCWWRSFWSGEKEQEAEDKETPMSGKTERRTTTARSTMPGMTRRAKERSWQQKRRN